MLPHGEISNQFTKEHLELMINATAACALSSKRAYKPFFDRVQYRSVYLLAAWRRSCTRTDSLNAETTEALNETKCSEEE